MSAGIIQRTESKLTRTVILKKSVLSASTVPFTVMLPMLRSMANNPSSLPESGREKDQTKVIISFSKDLEEYVFC